jgi:hypothetical protein
MSKNIKVKDLQVGDIVLFGGRSNEAIAGTLNVINNDAYTITLSVVEIDGQPHRENFTE